MQQQRTTTSNTKDFYTTLIDTAQLAALADRALILDVRHQLGDTGWGYADFCKSHIPGACFLSMDDDLAGTKTGCNGRHPLPDRFTFAKTLHSLGLQPKRQVVVLDQNNGAMAARLWWMIRHWLGHPETALLNGGWHAWQSSGLPQASGVHTVPASKTSSTDTDQCNQCIPPGQSTPALQATVDTEWVLQNIVHAQNSPYLLVDARSAERYSGQKEPIDPVAGHIPKAVNRPIDCNLAENGMFKPAAQLRSEWQALLGATPASQVVMQCGSGITACHNLLALEAAGLGTARLYVGSWSAWCAHRDLPKVTTTTTVQA